jgi:hypothetical protein
MKNYDLVQDLIADLIGEWAGTPPRGLVRARQIRGRGIPSTRAANHVIDEIESFGIGLGRSGRDGDPPDPDRIAIAPGNSDES